MQPIFFYLYMQQVTFYGSSMTPGDKPPDGSAVTIEGLEMSAIVHSGGMTLTGTDGKMVSAKLGCVTYYIMLTAVFKWFEPTLYQQFWIFVHPKSQRKDLLVERN